MAGADMSQPPRLFCSHKKLRKKTTPPKEGNTRSRAAVPLLWRGAAIGGGVVGDAHQPPAPTTSTNHQHQPPAPATSTNHQHQPPARATSTSHQPPKNKNPR
ncbi:MAG: hypothetical protein FWC61_02215 [Proteobacteria bacterium]|nr:hypothetical protein [Pseudomonadota bacterium]